MSEKSEVVIERVTEQLPHDFPKAIAEPVFESIKKKSQKIRLYLANGRLD